MSRKAKLIIDVAWRDNRLLGYLFIAGVLIMATSLIYGLDEGLEVLFQVGLTFVIAAMVAISVEVPNKKQEEVRKEAYLFSRGRAVYDTSQHVIEFICLCFSKSDYESPETASTKRPEEQALLYIDKLLPPELLQKSLSSKELLKSLTYTLRIDFKNSTPWDMNLQNLQEIAEHLERIPFRYQAHYVFEEEDKDCKESLQEMIYLLHAIIKALRIEPEFRSKDIITVNKDNLAEQSGAIQNVIWGNTARFLERSKKFIKKYNYEPPRRKASSSTR